MELYELKKIKKKKKYSEKISYISGNGTFFIVLMKLP